ncbi:MAG: hypothetical protein ACREPW_01015, partial [Candidatus Binataceae bacterium]
FLDRCSSLHLFHQHSCHAFEAGACALLVAVFVDSPDFISARIFFTNAFAAALLQDPLNPVIISAALRYS